MLAYCFASGQIGFGEMIPSGALPIAKGDAASLVDFIKGLARHGHSGQSLFVPGVSEAADESEALERLQAFVRKITDQLPDGVSTIYSVATRKKGLDPHAAPRGPAG